MGPGLLISHQPEPKQEAGAEEKGGDAADRELRKFEPYYSAYLKSGTPIPYGKVRWAFVSFGILSTSA